MLYYPLYADCGGLLIAKRKYIDNVDINLIKIEINIQYDKIK